jgi:signal peptidase
VIIGIFLNPLFYHNIISPVFSNIYQIKVYRAEGSSMNPLIKNGDLLVFEKRSDYEYNIDDIISFHVKDELITHRIIQIKYKNGERCFMTKGDNNNATDKALVYEKMIEGRLILIIDHEENDLKWI